MPRTRPNLVSIACITASRPAASSSVSTAATALMNHGWSEGGTGSLRYQAERAAIVTPSSASASRAALNVFRGGPQRGLPRLPPMPISVRRDKRKGLADDGAGDRLPFLLQRRGGHLAAGAAVPAAGVAQIAFDAVEIGMRPRPLGVALLLRTLVGLVPIALGLPPQRRRRHAQSFGRLVFGKRAPVSLEIHPASSW